MCISGVGSTGAGCWRTHEFSSNHDSNLISTDNRVSTFHISVNAQHQVKGHMDGAPAHKTNFLRHCVSRHTAFFIYTPVQDLVCPQYPESDW